MARNRSARFKAALAAKYRKARLRQAGRLKKRGNGRRLVKVKRKG